MCCLYRGALDVSRCDWGELCAVWKLDQEHCRCMRGCSAAVVLGEDDYLKPIQNEKAKIFKKQKQESRK